MRLLASLLIAAGFSAGFLLYQPDQYIDARPWRAEYIGIVIDVKCCDTDDIQSAIDKVAAHHRGIINLEKGTYKLDRAIQVERGRKVTLNGNGSTLMMAK